MITNYFRLILTRTFFQIFMLCVYFDFSSLDCILNIISGFFLARAYLFINTTTTKTTTKTKTTRKTLFVYILFSLLIIYPHVTTTSLLSSHSN